MHWLMLPISGAGEHSLPWFVAWHGRLMVAAWTILIPLGVLAARFFKVMPGQDWPRERDNRVWWQAHRLLQVAGVVLAGIGLMLMFGRFPATGTAARIHHLGGYGVLTIGVTQIAGGILRGSKGGPTDAHMRGDHFDMTPRRIAFERTHKALGWLSLPLAFAITLLGLWLADAPRWMLVPIAGWWIALAGLATVLQRQGRCIDTYQAIWGDDERLPGNRRPPIGWGVRRPGQAPTKKGGRSDAG